jgi:hypothetical protein
VLPPTANLRTVFKRSTVCEYTTRVVETHSQALKRKSIKSYCNSEGDDSPYVEFIELLRSMTTQEAMEAVPRIQAGHDIEGVLSFIKARNILLQLRTVSETRQRYNPPYSAQMPADLLASGSPYLWSLLYQAAWSESARNQNHDISGYQSKYLKP